MMISIFVLGVGALFFAAVGILTSDMLHGFAPFSLFLLISVAMSLALGLLLFRGQLRLKRALGRSYRKQRQLSANARTDALTGLPNRTAFMRALEKALARSLDGGRSVTVLLVNLDRFKSVNDTYGHSAGDDVLLETARRLGSFKETGTTLARLGDDEFAVMLEDDDDVVAERIGRRLLESLGAPVPIASGFVRLGATVGLATSNEFARTAETVLRAADVALREAKRNARGTVRAFEGGVDQALEDRRILELDLRRAITAG
ncbi:MAG: hypothetical protein ABS35_37230 [Kaistia sp. SCN 65-12]|nr:MAG: hypothetical protein ABS35_37230 [Kaistia sp. SCN 65-12]